MRRLVPALLACVGCNFTDPQHPVKPVYFPLDCSTHMFVDRPLVQYVNWDCNLGQEGRVGGHCDEALDVVVRCDGVPCTGNVTSVPTGDRFRGSRKIEIVPTAPGPLRAVVDLTHRNGLRDSYVAIACDVAPIPELALACTTRDPSTGEFVPCPARIPAGWDVHLDIRASVSTGKRVPTPDVTIDDHRAEFDDRTAPLRCKTAFTESRQESLVTCGGTLPAGPHHIVTSLGSSLPERAIDLEVLAK